MPVALAETWEQNQQHGAVAKARKSGVLLVAQSVYGSLRLFVFLSRLRAYVLSQCV